MNTQREMFEKWCTKDGLYAPLKTDAYGNYIENTTQCCWQAWQAAIAVQENSKLSWQPIDTAPKDGTIVDLWSKMHGRLSSYYRTDLGDGNVFYEPAESGYSIVRDATHWMPLPQKPAK